MNYDAIAEANYRMAEIYVSLGKRRKAIEHFRVALERSPNGEWGEQSKTYLEMLQ
jgi:tetratricopeptide (TPR) repeat protein